MSEAGLNGVAAASAAGSCWRWWRLVLVGVELRLLVLRAGTELRYWRCGIASVRRVWRILRCAGC